MKMTGIKLSEFLRYKTRAEELCIICVNGWRTAAVWIDHEDLFIGYLHPELRDLIVVNEKWELLETCIDTGSREYVNAHYVYVEV